MGGKLSIRRKKTENKRIIKIRPEPPRNDAPALDYEELDVSTYIDQFASDIYDNVSLREDTVPHLYDNADHGDNVVYEDSRSGTTYEEKCYDPQDPTLTFVDGKDEMDCK